MKSWYIINYSAEQDGYSFIELTYEEYKIIKAALDTPVTVGGGYCGRAYILSNSYQSREAAVNAVLNDEAWGSPV